MRRDEQRSERKMTKNRNKKNKKQRLASPGDVEAFLAQADGILSRSKKLGTMTASDKGISIKDADEEAIAKK